MSMLLAAALAGASPTTGEPASTLKPGMPYTNSASGISIVEYSDAERSYHEYRPDGLDVSVRYDDNATHDFTTIYIFKRTNGDASVWMDRLDETIHRRAEEYGAVTPSGPVRATPFAGASGTPVLRRTYSFAGEQVKSTGAAILANKDFYVSVRASSYRGTPAVVDKMLDRALASVRFPADKAPEATTPIAPCNPALAIPTAAAAPVKIKSDDVMESSIMAMSAHELTKATDPEPGPWCIELDDNLSSGVYRQAGTLGYWVAYGDNGEAANASPRLLDDKGKELEVKIYSADSIRAAAFYKTLPSPQQLIEAVDGKSFIYVITFKPNGDSNILINEDILK